jgi:MoaA/NifB/PqqE/SkfB family radical SAM enzyme
MIDIKNIFINMTNRCFSGCLMCSKSNFAAELPNDNINEITAEEIIRFIKDLTLLGSKFKLTVLGGEPLMKYNDTSKLFKYASFNGIEVHLCTNGYLINNAEKFLSDFPATDIGISIDGDTAEVNDYIRGLPGHFDKLKKIIPELREVIDRKNLATKLISCSIITKDNHMRLKEMEDFFKSLGIHSVAFNGMALHQEGGSPEDEAKRKKYYEENHYHGDNVEKIINHKCRAKKRHNIIMDSYGTISFCYSLPYYDESFFKSINTRFSIKRGTIIQYLQSDEYKLIDKFMNECKPEECSCSDIDCYVE